MTASDIPEISYDSAHLGSSASLAESLAAAATALHEAEGRVETARLAVRLATDIVPDADQAGISLVERAGRARTVAWTDEVVRTADAVTSCGAGCAVRRPEIWTSPVVRVEDITACDGHGPVLAGSGLRSALFLRLRGHQRRFSVLTLYSREPGAFDDASVRTGRVFSAHLGIALESVEVQEQLAEAMHTRDVIGQATGILMGRMNIDAAQAFDRLVRASQKGNVKLRDIASRIVEVRATE
ncbi:transcription antitermination regulator [Streptomyces chryseus]|uniref:Transcription antitermination regulator n=1 Tax=Streptomyces chryseus TaxID=68186 RepID=A0ABQ3E4P7_9ACTN|nr:transcription antitermination regulator [Streptomyces chryseus]GHB24730.1 transcription antitermination regulator [Streptomyces chryseus]